MQPRAAILGAAAIALGAVNVAAIVIPRSDLGSSWPMALTISQLALAGAALVWAPGPLFLRVVVATMAIGLGCALVMPKGMGWHIWLGMWLMLESTVAGLCWMLRIAGLQLVENATPGEVACSPNAPGHPHPELSGRQFSLASLFAAALLVALLSGLLRYVQLPEEVWVVAGLLCTGWAVMSVACLLIVGLEGTFWLRAIFAVLLVAFVVGVSQLLDLAAVSAAPPNVFLQVCTLSLPILGGAGLLIRAAGFELRWDE